MKKQLVIVGVLTCLFVNTKLSAQEAEKEEKLDEVVVTATKFETNKKSVGKIVYQITSETIKNNPGKTIVDFLNDVPGVEINGNYSTKGQNLGYYIRGGRNRQVAFLIDGINVNDPSSFNGDFDLRQIDINQVERIEVLKGASSTLYGTGAATGVVNIILKKAAKKDFSGSYTASVGSNRASQDSKLGADEFMANFNFNGTIEKIDYLVTLNANNSSGLSSAENTNEAIINKEDKFNRQNALLKLGYNVNENLRFAVFGSIDEFTAEFDGAVYDPVTFEAIQVDMDNKLESNQKRVAFTADYKYNKGALKVRTFLTDIRRTQTPSNDFFKGKAYGFDVFNNYKITDEISVLTGVTTQYQDMIQDTWYGVIEEGAGKQHFYDPYISMNYNSDFGFNLNAGGRLNIHNEYGSNFVFNVNPSYNIDLDENKNIKFFASYSTAFVTPTLSEIFTKSPILDKLLPEKDITIEGGFELELFKNITVNGTYFYREETDKIGYFYDSTTFQSFTVNDIGTFVARGVEAEIVYKPIKELTMSANYSYIDRKENLLLKIPKHKIGTRVDYKFLPKTSFSVTHKYVGKTSDFGGVNLNAYNVVDVFVNHRLVNDRVTLFGNVTNLTNVNYQEIAGFTTRGRNYHLGLRLQF